MGPSRLSSHGQAGQQTSLLKDCKSFLRSAHLRLAVCEVPYIFTRTRQQACIPRYAYQALLSQLFPEACAHTEIYARTACTAAADIAKMRPSNDKLVVSQQSTHISVSCMA